jgi:DNA-binding CsgD family transcriptional regulator
MADRTVDHRIDTIVGADRDPARLTRAVLSGTTVLVAGPLGSGKSHLLRTVTEELERRGTPPIVVRPGPVLSSVPFGALTSCPDLRGELLRDDDDAASAAEPIVLIIDDAHTLDPESAEQIARAIYRRRAVALLAIAVPRARDRRARDTAATASALVDLWSHGFAERIDLRELVASDAERLLDQVPGVDRLDSAVRAAVIGLADGSRVLLREFAAYATAALADGRDPLDALEEIPRHSRLGDALYEHVAELTPGDREALALLGRLPRIEYADATRFLSAKLVDGLISAGVVQHDGTIRRRLFANAALAAEAEHQLAPGRLDETIDSAASRMIGAHGSWWSIPLAVLIAQRWHGGRHLAVAAQDAAPALRARVALDAARRANDDGEPMLAVAYATLDDSVAKGIQGSGLEGALQLERQWAQSAILRSSAPLAGLDPAALDGPTLRRYLRLRAHVLAGLNAMTLRDTLQPAFADDPRTAAELDLAVAECAAMRMDWAQAEAAASHIGDDANVDGVTQLRGLLVSALARAYDGVWADCAGQLERAHRLMRAPSAPGTLGASERMVALGIELLAAQTAGFESAGVTDRLRDETVLASREGVGPAIVLAGLVAGLAHARAGNADGAISEIRAATGRSMQLSFGPAVALMQLSVARTLALLDRTGEARSLLRHAVETTTWSAALIRHEQALTESCILAAEGQTHEAIDLAQEARGLSDDVGARLMHLRDLYQVTALGAGDDVVLHRMRRIADATDTAAAHALTERAAAVLRGRKNMARRSPIERLRLGAAWASGRADAESPRRAPGALRPAFGLRPTGMLAGGAPVNPVQPALGLTRREREIAHLVAEGLTNREIAERLYLSVRTVESHVYQARAKVGARSRNELGRLVGRATEDRRDGTHGR